ncbi:RcnB family protein [Sphingorhabdus sp. YGSMI21]|uniref:RcnB family protein n=1 Tax=Sphingorhabdus sp. YGSMI21 TaxID=2077182 RepID=UPI001F0BA3B5|nr:RcnB family protein [Sphingorhabdus sp. YGSMI21]
MKTLLLTGIAGVLAVAPGSAIAAIDSTSGEAPTPMVDLSFASSTALANPAAASRQHNGNMRQMKGHRGTSSYVRRGRMGYDRNYRKPYRGFRLPITYIQPSYFISNFGYYGLSQPHYGYGWSRYYDDAVLTDRYGVVQDARYNVDWDRYNQGYQDGYRDGYAAYDPGVFTGDDRVVATPRAYNHRDQSTYRGDWQGSYREDGSYQGEWQGTYRDADGQVYQGEYSGTFIGDGNMSPHWSSEREARSDHYAPYPDDRGYDRQRAEDLAYLERCKKSSGIGGAIVGGAIGAFAGNRIAGSGNRLAGSLIGGGVGAVAGAAIDQGTDRCRKLLKQYGYDQQQPNSHREYPPVQHRRPLPPQGHPTYPSGWNGYYSPGYYYAPAQPMITTIVIQSAPVTTTTTTTYIEEEVVYSAPKQKKRWKPAPKKVWKPAPKAVPLKGCQQARCLYD